MGTDFGTREQTVLFGLLAVKLGKVSAEQWETAAHATLQASETVQQDAGTDATVAQGLGKDVGQILVEQGAISLHDAATIQGMAAEAIRSCDGDPLKAINSVAGDADTVHTLASSLFADPHDAVTLVERAGFDPNAVTIALDRTGDLSAGPAADSSYAETIATDAGQSGDSSYAETIATDSSHAATIASQTGGNLSHAATVMGQPPSAGAAATVMGTGGPGIMSARKPRAMTDALPAVPEHDGRYEFIKALSQGGMGQIVIVHDNHLGRDVALKTLLPDRVPGGTRTRTRTGAPSMEILTVPIIARFLQEARIAGQLEHPCIVPAYELGYRPDGTIYYTMQLVNGKALQDMLKECKTLEDRLKLLPNFLDVCNAIAFAHTRGVVHRDLKPLNVMIGEFGETLTIDWGIAKVKGAQDVHAGEFAERANAFRVGDTQASTKTAYGQAMGSPYFMPPEQAAGKIDEVDERADIYALGAILYVYLTGNPPYKEMKVMEFLDKCQSVDPKPIRAQQPDAPAELIAICERAMARKREDRYQNALELRDEVEKFINGGLVAAYKYTFKELFKRWVRKHWKILATAAAGVVAFLVLAVMSYIAVTIQRDEAIFQRGRAEEARVQAETDLYFANTSLAQRSIDSAQAAAARALLAVAPEKDRDWEWGHFQQLINRDRMTLEVGGQFVALAANGKIITGNDRGTISVLNGVTGASEAQLIKTSGYGYAFTTSADGKRAALNGPMGLYVWDLESRNELFHQPHTLPEGKTLFPFGVTLSADGARVAANEPDDMGRVWDVASGQKLLEAPANNGGVYLNPTGTQALVAHVDVAARASFVALHDLADGSAQKRFDFSDAGSVKDAVYSPDGGVVAFPTDNSLLVFETAGWQQLSAPIDGRFSKPDTVAFSSDGAYLAAATKDGVVLRLNVKSPQDALGAAVGHTAAVRSIAIASDAGLLVTGSEDRTIHVYSLATLELLDTYRGHDQAIFDVAVDGVGGRLLSASFDATTRVWDLGANVNRYFRGAGTPVAFSKAAGLVAIGVPQGVVLADAATEKTQLLVPVSDGQVRSLAWDSAGKRLAVYRQTETAGAIAVFDRAGEGSIVRDIATKGQLTRLGISGDGGTVIYEGNDDGVQLLDVGSGAVTALQSSVWAAAPAGNLIAVANPGADAATERVSVMQLPGLTEVGGFDMPAQSRLLWSADGAVLGVGTARRNGDTTQGVLLRWDVATKTLLPALVGHGQAITAFAQQGDSIATGSGDVKTSLILWDAATAQPRWTMAGHAGPVACLAFSPAGTRLVSGAQDGTFKLWAVADGRAVATIQAHEATAAEETLNSSGWHTAFTDDGTTLFTLSNPSIAPVLLHALP